MFANLHATLAAALADLDSVQAAVGTLPHTLYHDLLAYGEPGTTPEANGQILAELLAFLSTPAGQALLAALLKLIAG